MLNIKYLLAISILIVVGYFVWGGHESIDYSTQVKPIINTHCIACHGGVKKESGFSLLFENEAKGLTKSGKAAIVPYHPERSSFIQRLSNHDPDERMPYHKAPLKAEDIKTLTQWVKQGAKWGEHWAFVPLKNEKIPGGNFIASLASIFDFWQNKGNEIDNFINEKLEEIDLEANDKAEKAILLRRLSLDITGLPSPKHLADAYLNTKNDDAYNILVDSLLAQPSYGEKWANMWLDLARYADTKGFERDDQRNIWRYRDWVIKAFNKDMPYSKFITDQLAGDLLPNATDDNLIATAFLRNTMTNDEGGTDNEEYRTAAVQDRVSTNWAVLQSSSFNCVQCHSHPYDPFKHDEYYKYMAFFNNSADEDTEEDFPLLKHYPDSLQKINNNFTNWLANNTDKYNQKYWPHFAKTWQPVYNFITSDKYNNGALLDNKWMALRHNGRARLKNVVFEPKQKTLMLRYMALKPGGRLNIWQNDQKTNLIAGIKLDTTSGKYRNIAIPIKSNSGKTDIFIEAFNKNIDKDSYVLSLLWMALLPEFPKAKSGDNIQAKSWFTALNDWFKYEEATPIMQDYPQSMKRKTQVFERGNWMLKAAEVQPDIPQLFGGLPVKLPKNRLGLAQWMASEQNPLTARTAVNRVWEQLFGIGIVETLEDFGTQGLSPSHKELLDYLAYNFMHDMAWSQKSLIKKIVSSAAYKRSSDATQVQLEADPANRYLARGPRFRLSGEQLRDQVLAVSGLLNTKMYGPSVYPYQPDGLWNSPYNGLKYEISNGDNRYRRSLYTYWKRTSPYPLHTNFDAGSREVCTVRRLRTNTPIQALNTLNDPVFVEAARHWALVLFNKNPNAKEVIETAYLQALGQPIDNTKLQIFLKLYHKAFTEYENKPNEALKFLGLCADDNIKPKKPAATAAMALVINSMFNLDEILIKQ